MKSKRWVQASNPSYEGDDWADEYNDYYSDEDKPEVPPMPQIPETPPVPQQFTPEQESSSRLQLGSRAHNEATATHPPAIPTPPGVMRYALQDASPLEDETKSADLSFEYASATGKLSNAELAPPVEHVEPVAQAAHEHEQPTVDTTMHNATSTVPTVGEEIYEKAPEMHENRQVAANEDTIPGGHQHTNSDGYPDDIYGYYAAEEDEEEDEGKQEKQAYEEKESFEEEGSEGSSSLWDSGPSEHAEHTSDHELDTPVVAPRPISTHYETDSTASLSTGRPSMDSTAEARERISLDASRKSGPSKEPVVEEEPIPVGRWKPLPDPVINAQLEESVQTLKPDDEFHQSQDELTREILGSFNGGTEIDSKQRQSYMNTTDEEEPDPELLALYQSSSHFLKQDYDNMPVIEPLTTNKSRSSAGSPEVSSEMPPVRALSEEQQTLHPPEPTAEMPMVASKPVTGAVAGVSPGGTPILNQFDGFDSDFTKDAATTELEHRDIEETASASEVASVTSGNASDRISEPVNESDHDSLGSLRSPSVGGTAPSSPAQRRVSETPSVGSINRPTFAAKINRPPTFDFTGILSKPRSEDRLMAFQTARQREAEFDSGLQSWLTVVSSYHTGAGLHISGLPPKPSENEAKLATPQRTVSTTLMKPARTFVSSSHVTKEALGKVGEKSTKTAKGLFARGKKLLS
jgi:hypothetical protein